MKHNIKVTVLFMLIFLISQFLGLYLINISAKPVVQQNGATTISYADTAVGERPEATGIETLIYLIVGVLLGTLLLLFLAKRKKTKFWKAWFMFASTIAISVSLGVLVKPNYYWIAWIIAAGLSYWKIFYTNIYIHNFTEVLMYAGIAVMLVPILDVGTMFIVLAIFSAYDMYAVWKSKHMIKLAEFTAEANVFPGISIPYRAEKGKTTIRMKSSRKFKVQGSHHNSKEKVGILGGGDVVFPLFFSGTIMTALIQGNLPGAVISAMSKSTAFLYTLIPVATVLIALFLLFTLGKSNRFYPAIPFITAGCLTGYGILLLIL